MAQAPTWLTPFRRRVLRRALKIALAAAIATGISKAFGLQNPWFATLAAIVAMEVTLRASVRNARNTLVGAAIGAAAGLGLAYVAKEQVWAVGLLVLVAFVVFGLLRQEAVGRQAALVSTVIVLVPERVDLTTAQFAWVRFAETAIGIATALAVNAVVFPPQAHRAARRHLGHCYRAIATLYRLALTLAETGEADTDAVRTARRDIDKQLADVDALWDEAMSEHPPADVLAAHWLPTTRRIWEQCAALRAASPQVSGSSLLDPAHDEITDLARSTLAALERVADHFTDDRPLGTMGHVRDARDRVLVAVRAIEDRPEPPPVTEVLACFAFVNAMDVIASRLVDLPELATRA